MLSVHFYLYLQVCDFPIRRWTVRRLVSRKYLCACQGKSAAQWLLKHFTVQACSADPLLPAGFRVAIFHP
jgi:hypothetical protein